MLDVIILGSIYCMFFLLCLPYLLFNKGHYSAKKNPKKCKNILMYFAKGLFIQIALQSTSPVAVHNQSEERKLHFSLTVLHILHIKYLKILESISFNGRFCAAHTTYYIHLSLFCFQ